MKKLVKGNYSGRWWNPLPIEVVKRIKGKSWKRDSPVRLQDLAYLQVTHWNFCQTLTLGELVCHKNLAHEVVEIFQELFENSFPIERMRLIDDYDANDELSMQDNNSSAFNFREIVGQLGAISLHSWGGAIDLNPLYNPYVLGDQILPLQSEKYLDRRLVADGMIKRGEGCFLAFAKRSWEWGGDWKPFPDYHHFQKQPGTFIF